MSETTIIRPAAEGSNRSWTLTLRGLVGGGDRIALFTLPFVAVGVALNYVFPSLFDVPQMSSAIRALVLAVLVVGVVGWLWSAVLILTRVPKGELITNGPFAVVKHPLYTSVGLLVLPAGGLLLGSWLGLFVGVAVYAGSRMFAPGEERFLSERFGSSWEEYCEKVKIPWL